MGKIYRYKCKSCDFEEEYRTGGGILSDKYFDEGERLSKILKADALGGKYGDIIKAMVEADKNNELGFSCETNLFQCSDCLNLTVIREKSIFLGGYSPNRKYDINIEIKQACPKCGKNSFKKVRPVFPFCPKCKKDYLELVGMAFCD